MNKELATPVKLKIQSHKDDFDITIKAKVIGSEAVPLADMFIEQLKAREFTITGDKPPTVETQDSEKQSEPAVPVCPTHHTQLVKRKGQYGDFWTCPNRDEQGNWCKWKPEKAKKQLNNK